MADVPEGVRDFLFERIESYESLAVLLLLHAHPSQACEPELIARDVRISVESTKEALAELCEKGLAKQVAGEIRAFIYAAAESESQIIAQLAALYEAQPLEIMSLMNANAIQRLRTSMMKSFSNAFVFGRKKKDG